MTVRSSESTPLVGIGLPVYNGERFIERAIDSILAQTLSDFELVICDNASTDRTAEICQDYARRDSRVIYYRNERNLGAGPNYDLCFHRSRGKYFKWTAHDDMIAPRFLERCVALLEQNPDAVMCTSGMTHIGPNDEVMWTRELDCNCLGAASPARRFSIALLNPHGCVGCANFFSVYRRDALMTSQLHGNYGFSDSVMLAEMVLRGRSLSVREPYFYDRDHPDRLTNMGRNPAAMVGWYDQSKIGKREAYHLIAYANMWRLAWRTKMTTTERVESVVALLKWWTVQYNFRAVVNQVLWCLLPTLHERVRAIRERMRQNKLSSASH